MNTAQNNIHRYISVNDSKAYKIRLFCLPYAGGGAHMYATWQQRMPSWLQLCPVQLPGHGTRINEPLIDDRQQLISELVAAIKPYAHKPYALFGYSMGAMLSFELARHFTSCNKPPRHLVVAAFQAPQLPNQRPPIHELPDAELLKELNSLGGQDYDAIKHKEIIELMLPILRADFRICDSYSYTNEEKLNCPITLLQGSHDATVSRERALLWSEHTQNQFQIHDFYGDHFFIKQHEKSITDVIINTLQPFAN